MEDELNGPGASSEEPRESTRALVTRYGLLYGPIVGFANVLSALLTWVIGGSAQGELSVNSPASDIQQFLFRAALLSALLPLLVLLWTLGFTFLAGRATARRAGNAGAGALTGLVAGAFAGVAGLVTTLLILFLLEPARERAAAAQMGAFYTGSPDVTVPLIIIAIFGLALNLALGAGMGALGGLAGRSTFLAARPAPSPAPGVAYYPAANPYPYPYAPYPGQPPAPPRQGYQ